MNVRAVQQSLDALASRSGVDACALVDTTGGLVWNVAGKAPPGEGTWEAAVEYWRLHQRHRQHFESLGPLGAAVLYHHHAMLAIMPCCEEPPLVVVACGPHRQVDWHACQSDARAIGALVTGLVGHSQKCCIGDPA